MRFLALARLPEDLTETDVRADLEALVRAGRELGVRAVEMNVDRGSGRAFGLYVAARADAVREAHARAGVPCDEVLPVERWWAELVVPTRT